MHARRAKEKRRPCWRPSRSARIGGPLFKRPVFWSAMLNPYTSGLKSHSDFAAWNESWDFSGLAGRHKNSATLTGTWRYFSIGRTRSRRLARKVILAMEENLSSVRTKSGGRLLPALSVPAYADALSSARQDGRRPEIQCRPFRALSGLYAACPSASRCRLQRIPYGGWCRWPPARTRQAAPGPNPGERAQPAIVFRSRVSLKRDASIGRSLTPTTATS
jgi:hypothetical protein